jgi:hypothetical protein
MTSSLGGGGGREEKADKPSVAVAVAAWPAPWLSCRYLHWPKEKKNKKEPASERR